MKYEATGKYLRISTRKARLVADAVRTLSASRAVEQLGAMKKKGAEILSEILKSAMSNAKQKNADINLLAIERIEVGEGPRMKRWHAVSRGMAHPYKKRMTHIRVVLTDGTDTMKEKTVKKGDK